MQSYRKNLSFSAPWGTLEFRNKLTTNVTPSDVRLLETDPSKTERRESFLSKHEIVKSKVELLSN